MPQYDDYSDSDESDGEELQTNVLLGLPDGPISSSVDLVKPRVSRIGGLPVYPSGAPRPSLSASSCDSCHRPMELLVQLWCPFESSAYDRTLHVWGCSRASCQKKDGSVKSVRVLRFNTKYAAKLEAKSRKETTKAAKPKVPSSNPFSAVGASGGPQLFDGGFGDDDEPASNDASSSGDPSSASEGEDDDDEPMEKTLLEPSDVSSLASTLETIQITTTREPTTPGSSAPSNTDDVPAHPSLYLDTVFEYITPASLNEGAAKIAKKASQQDGGGGENQWGLEGYEKMQGIDDVFERFVTRVENEPQQCIRYELSGTPLPFSAESVYKRLFPLEHAVTPAPGTHIAVTGGKESSATNGNPESGKRVYDPSSIPPCDACGSPRAFECQLMPNLINVLRQARQAQKPDSERSSVGKKPQTDEERRAEVARMLRGDPSLPEDVTSDMEWGTCMVFSCVKDCCRSKDADGRWHDAESTWKDEFVLVQWDT